MSKNPTKRIVQIIEAAPFERIQNAILWADGFAEGVSWHTDLATKTAVTPPEPGSFFRAVDTLVRSDPMSQAPEAAEHRKAIARAKCTEQIMSLPLPVALRLLAYLDGSDLG